MKNSEFKVELEQRTKRFAVELLNFLYELPYSKVLSVLINWMELLMESNLLTEDQRSELKALSSESNELLALFSSISRTSRQN